jgi:hypothetical protein
LPAGAAEPSRVGTWALSLAYAWGFPSPDDLNRKIELDNLLLATAVPTIDDDRQVSLELRRGLSNRVSAGFEAGYIWKTVRDGQVTREIDAFPLTLSVAYFPPLQTWLTWNLLAEGGLLVGARAHGDDPLGGFSASGTSALLAGALEFEVYLSQNWSFRTRGTLQWMDVQDVPSAGETLDLSGGEIQIGIRAYIR